MFGWVRSLLRRFGRPPKLAEIRSDAEAQALVEVYRRRFSSGPVGVWVDLFDEVMGIGFSGMTGHFDRTSFFADGTGKAESEYEIIAFEWRSIGNRVIEVRSVERSDIEGGQLGERTIEVEPWQRVEYDFVVPRCVNAPIIFDAAADTALRSGCGSIDPFKGPTIMACLDRVSRPHRLRCESPSATFFTWKSDDGREQQLLWSSVTRPGQTDDSRESDDLHGRAGTLNWSANAYKMTIGVGSLGFAAITSELWRPVLPFWVVLVIALFPLAAFVLADPQELPAPVVRIVQIAGSAWYLLAAIGLAVALLRAGPLPRGSLCYFLLLLVGAIPCCVVLYRAVYDRSHG